MENILRIGVLIAAGMSALFMIGLIRQVLSFRDPGRKAAPRGQEFKGIRYAFGRGMMPWEKESASRHLLTYAGGFIYHFGIFAGLFWLSSQIISIEWGSFVLYVMRIFLTVGLLFGLGLFIKRSALPMMRSISCADDYLANLLVDGFLLTALLSTFMPKLDWLLYAASILLLLYIPIGKIRHCFFFFYSRILFGRFFGRRAVFPRRQNSFEAK
jgi:hypothetical protein